MKESHEGEARREGCLPLFMTLSFQDSEVGQVTCRGDELRVRFSAALVEARPAAGAGSTPVRLQEAGHLRGLEMRCSGARWVGDLPGCIGRLAHGVLVNGMLHLEPPARQTTVALPFEAHGGVSIELGFHNGSTLAVKADAVAFLIAGDASFTASLAC